MEDRKQERDEKARLYDPFSGINMTERERAQAKHYLHVGELIAEFIYQAGAGARRLINAMIKRTSKLTRGAYRDA